MANVDPEERRNALEARRVCLSHRLWATPVVLCLTLLALGACASTPPHYPSQTAQTYVGKTLFKLEMHWSVPSNINPLDGGHVASWVFNQYNYAGCTVTVHTDSQDIIRSVSWTQGCGPEPKQAAKRAAKPPAS